MDEQTKVRLTFQPGDVVVEVPRGENMLRAAAGAGVYIAASCGGAGTCGKCLVRVTEGETEGPAPDGDGLVKACATKVMGDVTIELQEESHPSKKSLSSRRARTPVTRAVFEKLNADWEVDPPTVKHHLQIEPPSMENNRSDVSRVARAVKNHLELNSIHLSLDFSRRIPHVLRENDWSVTATVYLPEGEKRRSDYYVSDLALPTLTNLEAGDTTGEVYGIALDIGTTSLCAELVDLRTGELKAFAADYNPQIQFGEDVLSRIVFSRKGDGLSRLQKSVVEGINVLLKKLIEKSGVARGAVCQMAAAGNTIMTHLLLGLDPQFLRKSPYVPVTNFVSPMRAKELGIDLGEHAMLFVLPSIASYIGGDIVSGLLATGVYREEALTLYIDVGTNGEVAVGNKDWIMTASCSAGPAFEGGGIEHGMIAAPGAIEGFNINRDTLEPMIVTVGMEKARGICGSGIINIAAELFRAGVLGPNGKFNSEKKTDRVRETQDGMEYVLVTGSESATGKDIVLTEADMDNLLRAKGAMYAGCQTLLDEAQLGFTDIDRVIIAGMFGSYLDLESAITVGLLPDLPREKFLYVGNGSLAGARLVNLSRKMLAEAEVVSKMMTNIELGNSTVFMNNYMGGMFLPHTNLEEFPSVTGG